MDVSVDFQIPQGINADLLVQQLKGAIANSDGLLYAIGNTKVSLQFFVNPSQADLTAATSICAAHDPTQKTAAQTASAQVASATATLKGKLAAEIAYFAAVPAPDLVSGVALARLCVDFASVLVALSTRLN